MEPIQKPVMSLLDQTKIPKHLAEIPKPSGKGYQLYTNGAEFTQSIAFKDWEQFGQMTSVLGGAMMWYIGDWINFGEKKWGEKYAQAVDATHYDEGTLRNASYVSRAYPLNERHPNLSWRHHADCAKFSIGDREVIFDMVERQDMTTTQLREFLHRQYPDQYKRLAGNEKHFDTWWARYAQSLHKDFAQNVDVIAVAKDAWTAGQKAKD